MTEVGQQGRRWFEIADSNLDRLDHQVALIAKSVEHRSTNLRVMGWFPTQINKIYQSFHECVRRNTNYYTLRSESLTWNI